jgi:hypothetical protein
LDSVLGPIPGLEFTEEDIPLLGEVNVLDI